MKKSRTDLENVKRFVDSTYNRWGNLLVLDVDKPYDPENSALGYTFKDIDPKTGRVIYKICCTKIGIPDTDFRVLMHEYGHIYLAHMDGIYEELDVQICNIIRDHRGELIDSINQSCGIDFADKLLERIIDDPVMNHSIHNIAMDMEVNSSILSKEDVEEMEMDISSVMPKTEEELLQYLIDHSVEQAKKDEYKEALDKMSKEAKIKLILPCRYNLGMDTQGDPIPFPDSLTYAEYLILIFKHFDQFIKMLVSIDMGGNGDTSKVTQSDIQRALNNWLQNKSQDYIQGYQKAMQDLKNQQSQNGQQQQGQGQVDQQYAQGYIDGFEQEMQNPQNQNNQQQGNQQQSGQGSQQQQQGQQSGSQDQNQSGQQGQQQNQGQQNGQNQQGSQQSSQSGQNQGQGQNQNQQGQNQGNQQSGQQNQSGQQPNDSQMPSMPGSDNGGQQQQGQGSQPGGQGGQENQQGQGGQPTQGPSQNQGQSQQGQGQQSSYDQGFADGQQAARNYMNSQNQQNGGQGNQQSGQQGGQPQGQNQGQGQNQNQQGQGQGQQGNQQGQGQGQSSQGMSDFQQGYMDAMRDAANGGQCQGTGGTSMQGLNGLMQRTGMMPPNNKKGQAKGQGQAQVDGGKSPHDAKGSRQDSGDSDLQKDHGSNSRKEADAKREVGKIKAGGGIGCGSDGSPDSLREVDTMVDEVDMAIKEVIRHVRHRVLKHTDVKDPLRLYNRGIQRKVIVPSITQKISLSVDPKLVFLIDISGSMNTELVDRVLKTIAKSLYKLNRGLRYDIITWSTRLGEHIKDINPKKGVKRISCGGGTDMASGMVYFKNNYDKNAILILISDFEDSLNEWHKVEMGMKGYLMYGFNYGYHSYDQEWKYFHQKNFSNYGYD